MSEESGYDIENRDIYVVVGLVQNMKFRHNGEKEPSLNTKFVGMAPGMIGMFPVFDDYDAAKKAYPGHYVITVGSSLNIQEP